MSKVGTVKLLPAKGKIIRGVYIRHGGEVYTVIAIGPDTVRINSSGHEFEVNRSVCELLKLKIIYRKKDIGELSYSLYTKYKDGDKIDLTKFDYKRQFTSVKPGDKVYLCSIPLAEMDVFDITSVNGVIYVNGLAVAEGVVKSCHINTFIVNICGRVAVLKRNNIRLDDDIKKVWYPRERAR